MSRTKKKPNHSWWSLWNPQLLGSLGILQGYWAIHSNPWIPPSERLVFWIPCMNPMEFKTDLLGLPVPATTLEMLPRFMAGENIERWRSIWDNWLVWLGRKTSQVFIELSQISRVLNEWSSMRYWVLLEWFVILHTFFSDRKIRIWNCELVIVLSTCFWITYKQQLMMSYDIMRMPSQFSVHLVKLQTSRWGILCLARSTVDFSWLPSWTCQ